MHDFIECWLWIACRHISVYCVHAGVVALEWIPEQRTWDVYFGSSFLYLETIAFTY